MCQSVPELERRQNQTPLAAMPNRCTANAARKRLVVSQPQRVDHQADSHWLMNTHKKDHQLNAESARPTAATGKACATAG